jgi:ABC-type glycerol-3-phosphate transport system substrate-binding protein
VKIMARRRSMLLGIVVLTIGCQQGNSTAPSTDPNRPGAVRRLTITVAGSQTIRQDGTEEVAVTIGRENIKGVVDVEFRNLPPGIAVVTKEMFIAADKSAMTVALRATPTATPVEDHVVTAAARARDEKDLPEVTTTFKLSVKPK